MKLAIHTCSNHVGKPLASSQTLPKAYLVFIWLYSNDLLAAGRVQSE